MSVRLTSTGKHVLRVLFIYHKTNTVYPLILRARSSVDSNLLLETKDLRFESGCYSGPVLSVCERVEVW